MFVNAAILIVAGAALYGSEDAQDLFSIHTLLSMTLAPVAGTLFALALLFSGQSSSIIATIVGQVICEGFINWKVRPFVRRGITRLIALIPCVIVASAIGKPGLNMALNISQVSLSILLPFVSAPLIWLTCSKKVMRVSVYTRQSGESDTMLEIEEGDRVEWVCMANGWTVAILGWLIWAFIAGLNVYLIVMLCLGNG